MIKMLIGLLLLICGAFGCSSMEEKIQPATELDLLQTIVDQNRTLTSFNSELPFEATYPFNGESTELSDQQLERLRITENEDQMMSKEETLEDIDLLHRTWKYSYAMYSWHGGDEAFNQAHTNLTETIDQEYSDEDEITGDELAEHLCDHYGFLTDPHVQIGGSSVVISEHDFYTTEELEFILDENGDYWLHKSDELLDKLVAINGAPDVEDFLVPSLNNDGKLVYYLGYYTSEPVTNPWSLEFESKDDREVFVRRVGFDYLSDRSFNMYEKDEVDVVQFRNMTVYEDDSHTYEDMLESAQELKDSPYFILDLRNNGSDNVDFVAKWYEEMFDQEAGLGEYLVQLSTTTNDVFLEETVKLYDEEGALIEQSLHHVDEDEENERREPNWYIENKDLTSIDDNDTPIFVLIDQGTSSAAERMTKQLKQVNQVYVVGVPSAGALSSSRSLNFELPNSQIRMSVPSEFSYHPRLMEKEGVGIEPDLWIYPRFAKNRVIAWIENHY
ncbi:S41 family peptidase [Salipaludibacillus keqinensis]|nr:S41 family peptidase [Salipaludibacillus keqinensis]